jgi:hypothetical protein
MEFLAILLLILLALVLKCHISEEGFSLSKKPFEQDWSLLHHGPYDNIDYRTPTFYQI